MELKQSPRLLPLCFNFYLMVILRTKLLFATFLLATGVFGQKIKKEDKLTLANLKTHVGFLADDKLEGRRAGSKGEKIAADYIVEKFKSNGIQPKGSEGYLQAFDINEGKQIDEKTLFSINDTALTAGKDYFPFLFSAQKSVEASPAIAVQEADMPWFIDLKEILEEKKGNPHFDLVDYIKTNSEKAYGRGATAVIIYNTSADEDKLAFNAKEKTDQLAIPVIYV